MPSPEAVEAAAKALETLDGFSDMHPMSLHEGVGLGFDAAEPFLLRGLRERLATPEVWAAARVKVPDLFDQAHHGSVEGEFAAWLAILDAALDATLPDSRGTE